MRCSISKKLIIFLVPLLAYGPLLAGDGDIAKKPTGWIATSGKKQLAGALTDTVPIANKSQAENDAVGQELQRQLKAAEKELKQAQELFGEAISSAFSLLLPLPLLCAAAVLASSATGCAAMASVAALCLQYEANSRPNMSIVVKTPQPLRAHPSSAAPSPGPYYNNP